MMVMITAVSVLTEGDDDGNNNRSVHCDRGLATKSLCAVCLSIVSLCSPLVPVAKVSTMTVVIMKVMVMKTLSILMMD